MTKPQNGDIWQYKRPDFIKSLYEEYYTVLVLDDSLEDYYLCLNLESGEIGDWLMDYGDEHEYWRQLA